MHVNMKRVNRLTTLSLLFLLVTVSASALPTKPYSFSSKYRVVETAGDTIETWTIQFRVNSTEIDPEVNGNAIALREVKQRIDELMAHPDAYTITGIRILGYASPEGPLALNETLATNRALALKNHIQGITGYSDDRFEVRGCGENWEELIQMLKADGSEMANKALEIIAKTPEGKDPEVPLRQYKKGELYKYLKDNYLYRLRSASTIQFIHLIPIEEPEPEPVYVPEPEPVDTVVELAEECGCRPPTFGIRTNALNLVLLIPSLGGEFYIGKQWALMCNGTYRWKVFSGAKNNHNVSTISGELRRFFRNDKSFEGWYMGLYGRYGEYDIKYGDTGRTGYVGGGGFSAGYVFHFNKLKCLYAELGAMAGFDHMNYRRYWYYEPTDCNVFDGHRIINRFQLTGLNASLVWRF